MPKRNGKKHTPDDNGLSRQQNSADANSHARNLPLCDSFGDRQRMLDIRGSA
jgi:hypothetical protein